MTDERINQNLHWRDHHQPSSTYQWGCHYGKDLLVDINQMAHSKGTDAVTRDLLQRAYSEIARQRDLLEETNGKLAKLVNNSGDPCWGRSENNPDGWVDAQQQVLKVRAFNTSRHRPSSRRQSALGSKRRPGKDARD